MPTQATHLWRPSHARLLVLDAFGPVARGASPGVTPPLCWPAKDPADILDYQFDISAVLLGNEGDGIATLDAAISPVEANGLTVVSATADGASAVLWLSGGVAGHTYVVTMVISTNTGRTIARGVLLPCLSLSTPPLGAALLAGTAPITDDYGSPIRVA